MKLLLLLVIVAIAFSLTHATIPYKGYFEILKKSVKIWHDDCVNQTGISEDNVKELISGKFKGDFEILEKYVACMWRITGVMDNFSQIIPDIAKSLLTAKIAQNGFLISKCAMKEASNVIAKLDLDGYVVGVEQCYNEKNPEEDVPAKA